MSGLLGDVLPYLYSRGDMLKRRVNNLLSDPIGTGQQAMGQASDSMNRLSGLMDQAFANPRSYQPTNQNKLAELVGELQSGPLGFAPAGMMAGVGAKTANKALLAKAEAMEKQGAAPHAIWRETGWGRGPEGKWRFEIDDSKASIKTAPLKMTEINGQKYPDFRVSDALDHPALFEAYPSTANIEQSFSRGTGNKGEYKPGMDWISLDSRYQTSAFRPEDQALVDAARAARESFNATQRSRRYNTLVDGVADKYGFGPRLDSVVERFGAPIERRLGEFLKNERAAIAGATDRAYGAALSPSAKSTQLHELQHAIQQREGFAAGGSSEDFVRGARIDPATGQQYTLEGAQDAYQRLAGEAEARLVQHRLNMTAAQRAAQFPWSADYFEKATGVPLNSLIFQK